LPSTIDLNTIKLVVCFMRALFIVFSVAFFNLPSFGFSLVGPYADWMRSTNGYHKFGDIGGPTDIGQGYRWNVPVVTYAFDQTFVDFFGSNGVAAVEGAIATLNGLPPASAVNLTNFPLQVIRQNYLAQSDYDYDLKSAALVLLLEQMGLNHPTPNVFDLRKWDPNFLTHPDESSWPPGTIPNFIIQRNFDPATLEPSHSVNGTYWSGNVYANGDYSDVSEFLVDPYQPSLTAVADFTPGDLNNMMRPGGLYCNGLTRDDVRGLAYLLSANTLYFETLLSDVHGFGTNANSFVKFAVRPGEEKITFVRQEYNSTNGQSVSITNNYTDTYLTNNTFQHQSVQRVIGEPDILFSAADLVLANYGYERTDTSRWWNSAAFNGQTYQTGPGVIVPPVKITFDLRGTVAQTYDQFPDSPFVYAPKWSSIDLSSVTVYPQGPTFPGADQVSIHFRLATQGSNSQRPFDWKIPAPLGGGVALQSSTNLLDWVTIATATNYTGSITWYHLPLAPTKFFRALPQ
jgi:hypothetical protein